ncbi:hypothetical protein ACFSTE_00430 [Aquimarina hainanensis]|uniref:Uncharacterized protein n=1 Tax=Aquimarina hainanensis TaxID=1578017 RepID=A0ABW5N274_9FLAO|nr:hypothetical protein [Aquimarina sp. TRL1]QKX04604.1 hypothetical protein HN014_06650 [Aquimarina sp. TRL1]
MENYDEKLTLLNEELYSYEETVVKLFSAQGIKVNKNYDSFSFKEE